MKTPKIVALALSLLGASLVPASAATVDYRLSVPLTDLAAGMTTGLLTGTLTLGDDALAGLGEGHGSFTFLDVSYGFTSTQDYSGWASMMPLDSGLGIYFDATGTDGGSLYFNLATTASGDGSPSGQVTFCSADQACAIYNGVGARMVDASAPAVALPGVGTGIGMSPVPLPPAVWMFGGALLVLAGYGAAGRRRHAMAPVRRA